MRFPLIDRQAELARLRRTVVWLVSARDLLPSS
jgi:hypothetical protein